MLHRAERADLQQSAESLESFYSIGFSPLCASSFLIFFFCVGKEGERLRHSQSTYWSRRINFSGDKTSLQLNAASHLIVEPYKVWCVLQGLPSGAVEALEKLNLSHYAWTIPRVRLINFNSSFVLCFTRREIFRLEVPDVINEQPPLNSFYYNWYIPKFFPPACQHQEIKLPDGANLRLPFCYDDDYVKIFFHGPSTTFGNNKLWLKLKHTEHVILSPKQAFNEKIFLLSKLDVFFFANDYGFL